MTFDRSLANITGPLVRDLDCSSSQLHETTVVLIFFSYRWIHSNAPTAYHYITWHLGIGDEHFLARLMPFLNIQLDIFNKCHKL